jgi:hypothetical protein
MWHYTELIYTPLLCRNRNRIKKSEMRIGLKPIISKLY